MLTLFYSPHMTSVDNEAGRASGHADVPLSDSGRQLARELGQYYARQELDAIFCSDLQRASVTAQIAFSEHRLPIVPDARLRETDFGEMTQWPPARLDEEQHITEPFPGGESILIAVQRVGAFLRDTLRDYDGKMVAVVGHKATKWGLDYWCGNASLREIVTTPWEWREIPIWRYTLDAREFDRRAAALQQSAAGSLSS